MWPHRDGYRYERLKLNFLGAMAVGNPYPYSAVFRRTFYLSVM